MTVYKYVISIMNIVYLRDGVPSLAVTGEIVLSVNLVDIRLFNNLIKSSLKYCTTYSMIIIKTINCATNLTLGKAAFREPEVVPHQKACNCQGADKGDYCNEDVETCRQFFVGSVRITGRKRDHLLMIFV